jgi:hypothetical protein
MANLVPTNCRIVEDGTGNHFQIARVTTDGGSHTVDTPDGLVSAGALPGTTGATAPTVTVSQADQQVTISGGSSGIIYVVSRHVGSAAGIG